MKTTSQKNYFINSIDYDRHSYKSIPHSPISMSSEAKAYNISESETNVMN